MAGVMMASPEKSEAPRMPSTKTGAAALGKAFCASAMSARVPPSPLLSARIRNSTYLRVTVRNRAQSSRETMPITSCSMMPPAVWVWARDSRNA